MQTDLTHITNIAIDRIDVPADHRKVHPDAALAVSESIRSIGLRQPIEVIRTGDRYRLVFGATRLAACLLIDLPSIPAFVKEAEEFADEAAVRLVTIAENFYRRALTVLDKSVDISDWCAIYRAAQPGIKPGPKPAKADTGELSVKLILNTDEAENDAQMAVADRFAGTFSDAAQSFLGVSRPGVCRALKIAGIAAELRVLVSTQNRAG